MLDHAREAVAPGQGKGRADLDEVSPNGACTHAPTGVLGEAAGLVSGEECARAEHPQLQIVSLRNRLIHLAMTPPICRFRGNIIEHDLPPLITITALVIILGEEDTD